MQRNLFLTDDSNSKTLLQFVLALFLLFGTMTANAQDPVTANGITSSCSALMGTYNYHSNVMGKPAYTFNTTGFMGVSVTYVLLWSGSQWEMGEDTDGGVPTINYTTSFSNPNDTPLPSADNWVAEADCSGAVGTLALSGGVHVGGSGSNDIPTLSEWGLIILALFLMTFGVLYQLQPRFRETMQNQ